MDRPTFRAARAIMGGLCGVYAPDKGTVLISIYDYQLDKDEGISFKQLGALSELFETDDIEVGIRRGWEGTEVTPGDPDQLLITIKQVG